MSMIHRLPPLRSLAAAGAVLVTITAFASAVDAQDLRYRTVTETEYAGFMGSAMSLSGEDTGPDTTTFWIKGLLRREDQANGKASWVIDLSSMDMMRIDHEEHVFWKMNFPSYMQSADSSIAAGQGAMTDEERAQMGSFEPSLEVDRTGETRTINGWEAERVIFTLTLAPPAEPATEAGADPMAAVMGQSSMVMLSDMWVSDDLPGYQEMREALGENAQDFAQGSGGMESLAAGYPQMASLVEQLEEEMGALEGHTVRTTTYTLMVPQGVPFHRDSILAMSDSTLPQGPDLSALLAQAMGEAARAEGEDAAADAVSQALGGRLGGLLRRGRDEEEEEEPVQVQMAGGGAGPTVMMRVVTEIIDVERPLLSEVDFQPPEGYTETEGPFPGG